MVGSSAQPGVSMTQPVPYQPALENHRQYPSASLSPTAPSTSAQVSRARTSTPLVGRQQSLGLRQGRVYAITPAQRAAQAARDAAGSLQD